MNWVFILLQSVVLLGLLSFMVALVYYVRHRHGKAVAMQQAAGADSHGDGGEFLKRYIPPEHRINELSKPRGSMFASKPLFYIACTLIPAVFLMFIGANYYKNRSEFLADIDLDKREVASLAAVSHEFDDTIAYYAPSFENAVDALHNYKIFVVFRKQNGTDYLSEEWLDFMRDNKLKSKVCYYESFSNCRIHKNSIAVMSLQHTNSEMLQRITERNASIWSYGFPALTNGTHEVLPGLKFEARKVDPVNELALVGDRELTLGMDAGAHFPIGRARDDVFAFSSNVQGISMYSDGKAGGEQNARIHADVLGQSRVVWMDFTVADVAYLGTNTRREFMPLLANMVKYLGKQKYGSIATWPQGRKYAAFVEQDTEDGFEVSEKVAAFFAENDYPVTWYALSDLVQKYRDVSDDLAIAGEMACHGDNHDIFPRYSLAGQTERMARCIKVIEAVTGEKPLGFRPPTEAFNNDTLSAALNAGFTHVFAESWTRTLVPHLKVSRQSGESLVSLPRAITDDYYLWPTLNLNHSESIARMMDELDWIRSTGALYGFSFHTQFMANDIRFDVVKKVAHAVNKDPQAWTTTAGELSDWWRARHDMIVGNPVSEVAYERFSPVTLLVDNGGELRALDYTALIRARPVALAESAEY